MKDDGRPTVIVSMELSAKTAEQEKWALEAAQRTAWDIAWEASQKAAGKTG